MTHYQTWVSYSGSARIWLAAGLLATAGAIAYTGTRLPLPARASRPGRAAATAMLGAWAASILALLVCADIYFHRYLDAYSLTLRQAVPPERIFPVTFTAAVVVFFVVLVRSPDDSRLASAAIAVIAGPMIFELPFDPIVIPRIYPPIPPDPAGPARDLRGRMDTRAAARTYGAGHRAAGRQHHRPCRPGYPG